MGFGARFPGFNSETLICRPSYDGKLLSSSVHWFPIWLLLFALIQKQYPSINGKEERKE